MLNSSKDSRYQDEAVVIIYRSTKHTNNVDYSEKSEKVVVESLQHYGKIAIDSVTVKEKI